MPWSYITLPDTAPHSLRAFFFPDTSFIIPLPPAAPEPRRPTLSRGDLRASLLHGADYLDASLDAMLGDDAELLRNLETLGGLVAVVIGQLNASSSNNCRCTDVYCQQRAKA